MDDETADVVRQRQLRMRNSGDLLSVSVRAEQTFIGSLAPYDVLNSLHSQFLENSQNLMCKHNDSVLFLEMAVNSN